MTITNNNINININININNITYVYPHFFINSKALTYLLLITQIKIKPFFCNFSIGNSSIN